MEDETWNFGLSTTSRSYQSRLKSHFELCIDFDDVDGDDELKTVYPCPFCTDYFDLLELCCHIDEEHPIESKSGICPVCATWVGSDMVGNIQHKSRYHKPESYSSLSFSRKDLEDEHWQSFSAGPSRVVSASRTAHDSWLSFLHSAAAPDERGNVQHDSSSENIREEIHSDGKLLERDFQPSSPDKNQAEKAQRSEFVQGLLMSTILDSDF
ncbi:hypothetical protein L6164_034736 [Bauhinia variegata]|uniref:Uncharacterized protein n=1 Tax=Bauhinia variegata TaxID=167791 RepID=A0ACB9KW16_BAUVA|nr:hypothetical protein L6164_034736 [Bauhinia variegata]